MQRRSRVADPHGLQIGVRQRRRDPFEQGA